LTKKSTGGKNQSHIKKQTMAEKTVGTVGFVKKDDDHILTPGRYDWVKTTLVPQNLDKGGYIPGRNCLHRAVRRFHHLRSQNKTIRHWGSVKGSGGTPRNRSSGDDEGRRKNEKVHKHRKPNKSTKSGNPKRKGRSGKKNAGKESPHSGEHQKKAKRNHLEPTGGIFQVRNPLIKKPKGK